MNRRQSNASVASDLGSVSSGVNLNSINLNPLNMNLLNAATAAATSAGGAAAAQQQGKNSLVNVSQHGGMATALGQSQIPSLSQSMTHQMQQQLSQQQQMQQQQQQVMQQQQMQQQLTQQQQQHQQMHLSMSHLRKSIKDSEQAVMTSKSRMGLNGTSSNSIIHDNDTSSVVSGMMQQQLSHSHHMSSTASVGGGSVAGSVSSHQSSYNRNSVNVNNSGLSMVKNMNKGGTGIGGTTTGQGGNGGGGPGVVNSGQSSLASGRQSSGGSSSRGSTSTSNRDSDPHHKLMKPKDARPLIDSLPWEEKIVYLSRHVMGGRKGNGYFRTLAQLKKLRRVLVKDKEGKGVGSNSGSNKKRRLSKSGGGGGGGDAASVTSSGGGDLYATVRPKEELEELKNQPRIAKNMIAEMGLGITFCNTIASTIESILSDIDPQDKKYRGGHPGLKKGSSVKPVVAVKRRSSISSSSSKQQQSHSHSQMQPQLQQHSQPPQALNLNFPTQPPIPSSIPLTTAPPPSPAPKTKPKTAKAAKSTSPVNKQAQSRRLQVQKTHGSMLRKDRDKQKGFKAKDPIETMIIPGEKKPTKRELAHRHFEATRYQTLKVGDYVLARPQSQEIWILARIVQDWMFPNLPITDLKKMAKVSSIHTLSNFFLIYNIFI